MASAYDAGYQDTTATPAGFSLPLFKQKYMTEFIRTNRFSRYMGAENDMPIQIVAEPKKGGETVKVPMIGRLKKRGVYGNMPLSGREEELDRQSHTLTLEYRRNAVSLTERDEQFVFARALGQVRPHLLRWSKEQLRDDIIDAMFSVSPRKTMLAPLSNPDATQVLSGDPSPPTIKTQASDGELDAWLTDNADRALFHTIASQVAGDFSGSIAAVGAGDVATAATVRAAKDLAVTGDPHITPIMVGDDDEEYFIMFVSQTMFRQLQTDQEIRDYNNHALERGSKRNPIRTGADLEFDGVVIRPVPEIGNHSAGVTRGVLCGAEAIGVGIGMDPDFRENKNDDYGHLKGIGITECIGVEKLQRYDGTDYVDYGTVTVFTATA
jgi:hypothetical protein